jgi:hypothetical protein
MGFKIRIKKILLFLNEVSYKMRKEKDLSQNYRMIE